MKIYYLSRKIRLPITQDVAWAFFSNPASLSQLTPPDSRMVDESIEQPKKIYAGMLQVFRVSPVHWLPSVRWVAEISHVDAPNFFVDEQKVGPFAFWHHRHSVIPVASGVEIEDTVHYAMPFGILGELVHALFVRKQLERLFEYRHTMLEEFFGET
ncbi:MAG: cell division inhibitor [Vampirovibrio sp.]|jgi:ligand-binding SRPBCC domain-containing protein|nr:cell division inhibitor [Vampirovibrio sp.]